MRLALLACLFLAGCSHIPAADDKAFRKAVSEADIYGTGNVNSGQIEGGVKFYYRNPYGK